MFDAERLTAFSLTPATEPARPTTLRCLAKSTLRNFELCTIEPKTALRTKGGKETFAAHTNSKKPRQKQTLVYRESVQSTEKVSSLHAPLTPIGFADQ